MHGFRPQLKQLCGHLALAPHNMTTRDEKVKGRTAGGGAMSPCASRELTSWAQNPWQQHDRNVPAQVHGKHDKKDTLSPKARTQYL